MSKLERSMVDCATCPLSAICEHKGDPFDPLVNPRNSNPDHELNFLNCFHTVCAAEQSRPETCGRNSAILSRKFLEPQHITIYGLTVPAWPFGTVHKPTAEYDLVKEV